MAAMRSADWTQLEEGWVLQVLGGHARRTDRLGHDLDHGKRTSRGSP